MPFYKGTIFKRLFELDPDHPWTNVYTIDAADEAAALLVLAQVRDLELDVSYDIVEFYKMTVRQDSPLAGSGQQQQLTDTGNRDSTGKNFLPLFCTARVRLTDNVARPDQKYLRLPFMEDEQDNGFMLAVQHDFLMDTYVTPLLAVSGVVSSSHQPLTSGAVELPVQMRQRGWHRRVRVGFHRGWVPDA